MAIIANILDTLSRYRDSIALIDSQIRAICSDLYRQRDAIETKAKILETEAKAKAEFIPLASRHTLRGTSLQLVYNKSSKWNESNLIHLCGKYGIPQDELNACKDASHYWSIRKLSAK